MHNFVDDSVETRQARKRENRKGGDGESPIEEMRHIQLGYKLKDRVAIVGIGQTAFTRPGESGRTAISLALEAVVNATADAGIGPMTVDGFVTYGTETSDPYTVAQTLGITETCFMDRYPGGGESLAGTVHHAAMAIEAGVATTVVAYRSLSGRLIRGNEPPIKS